MKLCKRFLSIPLLLGFFDFLYKKRAAEKQNKLLTHYIAPSLPVAHWPRKENSKKQTLSTIA